MLDDSLYNLLRADGSIVINKNLVHSLGNAETQIFSELLSKYFYYKNKDMLQADNTFYCTQLDLYYATGIFEKSQRTAIKRLSDCGFIETKIKGLPPKRYIKIIADINLIFKFIKKGENIRNEIQDKYLNIYENNRKALV